MTTIINTYQNGNASIEIQSNGTRIINFDGELQLEYPLNIDIRVSEKCSMGFNPATNTSRCAFCHESARVDGNVADFDILLNKLAGLPAGIELAIGVNQWNKQFEHFLQVTKDRGWIVNATVNHGHLLRDYKAINNAIQQKMIYGVGISYRKEFPLERLSLIQSDNVVLHVIAGIDDIEDVRQLSQTGIKKLLILGEKDFGFNINKVNLDSVNHKNWYRKTVTLLDDFEVVSFDNLALEQINFKRFITDEHWNSAYQGEHSMYINAVSGYFAPSSRSNEKTNWDKMSLKEFFKQKEMNDGVY